MREFRRTDRFGAELQRELALVLREEVKDPRLGMVTVQAVRVSRDLSHAKVYFPCMGGDAKGTEKLLNRRLAGFLRHELAHRSRRLVAGPGLGTERDLHLRHVERSNRVELEVAT